MQIVLYLLGVRLQNDRTKPTNNALNFFSHLINSLIYRVILLETIEDALRFDKFSLLVFDFFPCLEHK